MIDLSSELSKASGDASRTSRAGRHIADAAHARREELEHELAELRPQTLSDEDAAARYQELVLERGRIDLVLSERP